MDCSKIYYENQLEKQIETGNSNFLLYDYAYNNSYVVPVYRTAWTLKTPNEDLRWRDFLEEQAFLAS